MTALPQVDLITGLTIALMGLVAFLVEKLYFQKGRRGDGA